MSNLPDGVKILDNGQMEVEITFDVTKHGHNLGLPRNYNVTKIAGMINDSLVQETIKNGYGKGYYGHGKRDSETGLAPEVDSNGGEVEPVCLTKQLSISGNMVTHKQRIFNTDKGERIQNLILNGGVGFSAVWDIVKKKFYGFDVVISPNFAGNRVVMDSICTVDGCAVDLVDREIEKEVYRVYGVDVNSAVMDSAVDLLKHQDDVKRTMRLCSFVDMLNGKVSSQKSELSQLAMDSANEIETLKAEIESLKEDVDGYKIAMDSISSEALKFGVYISDSGVALSEKGLDGIFSKASFDSLLRESASEIKMLNGNDFSRGKHFKLPS